MWRVTYQGRSDRFKTIMMQEPISDKEMRTKAGAHSTPTRQRLTNSRMELIVHMYVVLFLRQCSRAIVCRRVLWSMIAPLLTQHSGSEKWYPKRDRQAVPKRGPKSGTQNGTAAFLSRKTWQYVTLRSRSPKAHGPRLGTARRSPFWLTFGFDVCQKVGPCRCVFWYVWGGGWENGGGVQLQCGSGKTTDVTRCQPISSRCV